MSVYAQPSICIPRVFANIGWKRIKSTIEEAGWGTVAHVDMIMKTSADGQEYKRVFVHFTTWSDTDVQADLMADKEVMLTYNDPWFWKITKSRSTATGSGAPPAKLSDSTGAAPRGKHSDYTKRPSTGPAATLSAEATSVAALEQTVRMQAQQLQLLTSLMLQQQGLSGTTAMMPIPAVTPMKPTHTSVAPAAPKKPMKALGDGYYKEKRNYRTPPKRLDFLDKGSNAVEATETTTSAAADVPPAPPASPAPTPAPAPPAPKKLLLRRKLEDADDDAADAE